MTQHRQSSCNRHCTLKLAHVRAAESFGAKAEQTQALYRLVWHEVLAASHQLAVPFAALVLVRLLSRTLHCRLQQSDVQLT